MLFRRWSGLHWHFLNHTSATSLEIHAFSAARPAAGDAIRSSTWVSLPRGRVLHLGPIWCWRNTSPTQVLIKCSQSHDSLGKESRATTPQAILPGQPRPEIKTSKPVPFVFSSIFLGTVIPEVVDMPGFLGLPVAIYRSPLSQQSQRTVCLLSLIQFQIRGVGGKNPVKRTKSPRQ